MGRMIVIHDQQFPVPLDPDLYQLALGKPANILQDIYRIQADRDRSRIHDDAEFKEEEHPRDPGGKFTAGGGEKHQYQKNNELLHQHHEPQPAPPPPTPVTGEFGNHSGDKYFKGPEVDAALQDMRNPKSRTTLVHMSPEEFLSLALSGMEERKLERARGYMKTEGHFTTLPQLRINENGRVIGHEGRHRARVLKGHHYVENLRAGVEQTPLSMPVELHSTIHRWGEHPHEQRPKELIEEGVLGEDPTIGHRMPMPKIETYPTQAEPLPAPPRPGAAPGGKPDEPEIVSHYRELSDVNEWLRGDRTPGGGGGLPDKVQRARIKELDELIERNRTTKPLTVYRGFGGENVSDLMKNGYLRDKGFMSTSKDEGIARQYNREGTNYALPNTPEGGYLAKFEIPAGFPAFEVGDTEANEVILPRGLRWKLEAVHHGDKILTFVPVKKPTGDKAPFREENVNRNTAKGHEGEFASDPGVGTKAASKPVTLKKAERTWTGKRRDATKLTKQQAGNLGEQIALAFIRDHLGFADANPLNTKAANFAVDMIGDHHLYEIKTGQVSNSAGALQWRATIGEPGDEEKDMLAGMNAEEKARYNRGKVARIMERKEKQLKEYSRQLGRTVSPKTVTILLDPDLQVADVHVIDGFHKRIGYNSVAAKSGYVGSFRYQSTGEGEAGSRPANRPVSKRSRGRDGQAFWQDAKNIWRNSRYILHLR